MYLRCRIFSKPLLQYRRGATSKSAKGFNTHACIDWSRRARLKRKLEAAGEASGQSRITDYFELTNTIALLLKENRKMAEILQQSIATEGSLSRCGPHLV